MNWNIHFFTVGLVIFLYINQINTGFEMQYNLFINIKLKKIFLLSEHFQSTKEYTIRYKKKKVNNILNYNSWNIK